MIHPNVVDEFGNHQPDSNFMVSNIMLQWTGVEALDEATGVCPTQLLRVAQRSEYTI
jgi:hypothetical protein